VGFRFGSRGAAVIGFRRPISLESSGVGWTELSWGEVYDYYYNLSACLYVCLMSAVPTQCRRPQSRSLALPPQNPPLPMAYITGCSAFDPLSIRRKGRRWRYYLERGVGVAERLKLQLSALTTDHLAHKSSVFQGITSPRAKKKAFLRLSLFMSRKQIKTI